MIEQILKSIGVEEIGGYGGSDNFAYKNDSFGIFSPHLPFLYPLYTSITPLCFSSIICTVGQKVIWTKPIPSPPPPTKKKIKKLKKENKKGGGPKRTDKILYHFPHLPQ